MTSGEAVVVILVGFGAAFLGAVMGSVGALLIDVWRRVLDGLAAARLIRNEIQMNHAVISAFVNGIRTRPPMSDQIWKQNGTCVAPLMSDVAFSMLARDQALIVVMQKRLEEVDSVTAGERKDPYVAAFKEWSQDLRQRFDDLQQLEATSKLQLMRRILFHVRPASRDELLQALLPDVDASHQSEPR